MDTSTVLSIVISLVSIIISVIFAIAGFLFTRKGDTTLSSIQKEVNVQSEQFMHLLEKYHQSYDDLTSKLMDLQLKTLELQKPPKPLSTSRKVDPKSSDSIPRNPKLPENDNEEKK